MRDIQFYRSDSGHCPVEAFLDGLGPKHAQKVAWVLKLVKELPLVPKQYLKKLEGPDELWEVRAEFGGDAFRLLGFWDAGSLIILTNGFAKKTRKTPSREIELAAQRRRDYLNRKGRR
ncbi:MAG: type II toxin-antitoxin system RelE/ParE family toxin [Verrucomicrobiota bacterium]|jgi:phage-related protein